MFGTPLKVDPEAPDYVQIWPDLTALRGNGLELVGSGLEASTDGVFGRLVIWVAKDFATLWLMILYRQCERRTLTLRARRPTASDQEPPEGTPSGCQSS